MKGKSLRRALASTDAIRVNADIPAITDTTELITPAIAQEMLQRNKANRPINWRRVEEYSRLMRDGKWVLHAQGIILDKDGNILTGQKRLWAVVYAGCNVYMRVSRGNPPSSAKLIDRGDAQSARDLAARGTGRKHSPTEAAIARAYMAQMGNVRPSTDQLAEVIEVISDDTAAVLKSIGRTKKTREILMIIAALIVSGRDKDAILVESVQVFADELASKLSPQTAAQCWGKGAAFGLAMRSAMAVVQKQVQVRS